jgi:hypothetical protein
VHVASRAVGRAGETASRRSRLWRRHVDARGGALTDPRRCASCGAPATAPGGACAYCGTPLPQATAAATRAPGEFGPASHAFFWAFVLAVTTAEVVLAAAHFGAPLEVRVQRESRDWALLFGAAPGLLLLPGLLWGPRKGKWASAAFLVLPALGLLAGQVAFGRAKLSGDDLGYAAACLGASLAAYLLGAGIHAWIRSLRV